MSMYNPSQDIQDGVKCIWSHRCSILVCHPFDYCKRRYVVLGLSNSSCHCDCVAIRGPRFEASGRGGYTLYINCPNWTTYMCRVWFLHGTFLPSSRGRLERVDWTLIGDPTHSRRFGLFMEYLWSMFTLKEETCKVISYLILYDESYYIHLSIHIPIAIMHYARHNSFVLYSCSCIGLYYVRGTIKLL